MNERRLVIMIVEDEAAHVEAIQRAFSESGMDVDIRVASTLREYRQSIAAGKPDLALMDLNLSDGCAMDVLVSPPEDGPSPILIMTSYGNENIAVESIRSGAMDYMVKSPEAFSSMPRVVERSLREWKLLQEHRKSDNALKEREEWFRTLFENATDGIFYLSSAGKIVMLNESFARMHGYTVAEMLKIDLRDLDTPESAKLIPERMRRVLSGENLIFEVEQYCKDGSIIPLEVSTTHITVSGEKYILAFHRDISERKRVQSSLIMSEARYRHLFENMLEGYAYCKMLFVDGLPHDFIYIHVNPAFETLTGLKNVVGRKVSEVIPGIQASDPGLFKIYGRVAMTGKPERFETYVQALQIWFSISVYSPEKEFFVAVFDIITERKQVEAQLIERAQLAQFQATVAATLAGPENLSVLLNTCCQSLVDTFGAAFARIWTLNEKEQMLELQASAGQYTHLNGPHGRLPVGKCKVGLIASERKPHLTNQVIGDPQISDQDWARREGMVAFAGYPLMMGDRVVGVMAIFARHRLTEHHLQAMGTVSNSVTITIVRKRAERTLAENEARLRLLVETIPDLIWLKDADGIYLTCNKVCEQFFGTKESDIVGKTDYDFVGKELADFLRDHDRKAIAAGKPSSNIEWATFLSDGHRVLLNTIKTPMYDAEGMLLGVLSIGRDITELQKLEDQLRHAQKMEGIGTLAGGIAHDFNNILSAIVGYGHITLMKMQQDDPLRMNIEHILESADRAAALTRSLLTFSRKQVIDRKPVELNSILKRVEKFLVRVIGEDVVVHVVPAGGDLTILADTGQLEQVLMNLATNARDAMPNGGLFTLETAITKLDSSFAAAYGFGETGTYALISATDTGVGMTEETRVKIFEPFFTTKEVGKGTGLGLAMVYGIIKQHEGFINVYSEPGKGTTFRIYLPLIKTAAMEEQRIIAAEYPKGGTETVLFAEDDATVRKLTLLILEQMGYTVIIANDGEEAVTKFMENKDRIQLLLFDIIMPKKNGREAYEEIKKIKPDIPVLFASGYSPDMLSDRALIEKGAAIVFKPISPLELAKKVREVLDRQ